MKKTILFAVSFLAAEAVWAQQASTQAVNADSVPIEEYVPKVIIEGKWGAGPGEFGAIADPMQSEQYGAPQYPGSLAVNTSGEIYVLDHVNGRIQKFSKEGKYQLSVMVPGCADESGKSVIEMEKGDIQEISFELRRKPAIVGVNIVIDSKDTLYYYLKRTKDGKETGEVWEFKKDKLVKKALQKSQAAPGISAGKYVDSKIDARISEAEGGRFDAIDGKKRKLRFQLAEGEELYGKRQAIFDESLQKWTVRIKKKGKVWFKNYDASGKLLSIGEVSRLSEFSDSYGNYYFIEIGQSSFLIKKNELVRTLK